MAYKITPSLYNAWLFYAKPMFDRTPEQEVDAKADFMRVLRKEPSEPSPAILKGINFENAIEEYAKGTGKAFSFDDKKDADEIKCAEYIAKLCHDGEFQVRGGQELPSGNYVYGIADCILLNGIVDFKRVGTYEIGKYQNSIQHLVYMYIWGISQFHYLVCDGSSEPFEETYTWDKNSLAMLESRIAELIGSVCADSELKPLFDQYWLY